MPADGRVRHIRRCVRRAATAAAALATVVAASTGWTPRLAAAATTRQPSTAAALAAAATPASPPPRGGRATQAVPPPAWRSLPPGWTFEPYSDCSPTPALPLASGGLLVPVVPVAQRREPLIRQRCALAVLGRGGWHVLRLAAGEFVSAAAALGQNDFVVGTLRQPAASLYGAAPVPGPLLLFTGVGLSARALPLPHEQYVDSLAGLPAGGFAVGTAAAACRGSCGGCGPGRLGVASPAGKVRWFTPPPFRAPLQVEGMAPWDAPCGVVVGPTAGGSLWFALDGVGVARLDPATGRFTLPAPGQYDPLGYGPIQFLGAALSTVYYAVHRLPGVADAGYWGPLFAVTYGPGGSVREYLPAPGFGCIQGGVGAPTWMVVIGRRLWVRWQDCPVYSAVSGAAALGQPAPACRQTWRNTAPGFGFPVALLPGERLAESCGTRTDPRFYVVDGRGGRVLTVFGWPRSLAAGGLFPAGFMKLLPAPAGGIRVLTRVHGQGNRTVLVDIGPTGQLRAVSPVPASTVAVVAHGYVWLVSADAVARMAE